MLSLDLGAQHQYFTFSCCLHPYLDFNPFKMVSFPSTVFLSVELRSLVSHSSTSASSILSFVRQPAKCRLLGFCPLCCPPSLSLHIFALSRVAPATVALHRLLALKLCSCFQIRPLGFDPHFPLRVVPVDTSFLLVFCGSLHILTVSCSGGCVRRAYCRCRTFLDTLWTSWFILGCRVQDLGTVVLEFAQVIK